MSTAAGEPVTVVVTRRVRAGRERDYEAWLATLLREAEPLEGYLGATIHPPPAHGPRDYTSVFRFATVAQLRAFEASPMRARALRAVAPLVEGDARWRELSGFELWFEPPAGTVVPQPSRWRMAVVMVGVVYLLVLLIGSLVAWALPTVPAPLRLLVTIAVEVSLLTWFIMPRLTRALARWIYPPPALPRT